MQNSSVTTEAWWLAAAVAFALFGAAPVQAITVTASAGPAVVQTGERVDVVISIDGLADGVAPSVGTYDVALDFNDTVLDYLESGFGDATLGNQLDPLGFGVNPQIVTPSAGRVSVFELSLDSESVLDASQAPAFDLFTLSFIAVAVGTSDLTPVILALGSGGAGSLAADTVGDTLSVSAVPVPGAAWLFAAALASVGALRRR